MQKNANETAKETKNMFLQSAKELKAVTTLAACAMFAALAMILNQVASIDIGPYVRIGFSGIPNRLVDYLFGPVTGCLFSGILDVVKYFLKPSGPFFFGFTFNAMLASFMYGCFYYRKKLTIKRVLAAKFIVMLTVDQHAVWKRNHGASSGTCLKEPDYVADRFHHFLQPDEVDRADRRLPHVPCKNRCTGTEIKKNSDTIKTIHLPICRKGTVRQNKKEADGFCRKRKAKKNCGRNFPKRKPAAVLFV